jgi:uncharacterized protein involved in exopolysaccharide biosynthesis
MEDTLRYNFNSSDILFKVYSHRKPIIIITTVAIIVSTIVSFVITPKFRASTVLFPAPAVSISKSLISVTAQSNENSIFGEDEEVEQVLQVLNSEELQKKIVKKYDLVNHYDLDSADPHLNSELNKKWEKYVSFGRTQFMAIEISVLDKSPDIATSMANDITSCIDSVMNRMEKERATKAYEIVKIQYKQREEQVQVLSDSLRKIMELGVYDIEAQSGSLNRGLTQAYIKGNQKAIDKILERLALLAKYGSKYLTLKNIIESQSIQLSLLNSKCNEAKVDAEQSLTHIYVVDKAYRPDKKAFPQRALIILISALSTFLLSILIVIIIDALKDFKGKELNSTKA